MSSKYDDYISWKCFKYYISDIKLIYTQNDGGTRCILVIIVENQLDNTCSILYKAVCISQRADNSGRFDSIIPLPNNRPNRAL